MAKLPTQKKIMREDLKDAPGWIDKMLYPINSFFESVYGALSKNITFSENIACQIKDAEFTCPVAWDPKTTLVFDYTIKSKPQGVIVLQIADITTGNWAPMANAVTIDWQSGNGQVQIGSMTGLTAGQKYKVRFLVI